MFVHWAYANVWQSCPYYLILCILKWKSNSYFSIEGRSRWHWSFHSRHNCACSSVCVVSRSHIRSKLVVVCERVRCMWQAQDVYLPSVNLCSFSCNCISAHKGKACQWACFAIAKWPVFISCISTLILNRSSWPFCYSANWIFLHNESEMLPFNLLCWG